MNGYPRAVVESSLERVLRSAVFRRSDRHRRFMRHVVEAALEGRSESLKELLIGIELFDRKLERYEPRTDPIVRVEAGRIRAKLTRYYLSEGSGDAYGFDIPAGGYVPRFERRQPAAARPRATVETYAVMPFATRGGDEADFAIGLADQVINLLGRVRDVRVVARVSALKASERNLDIQDIARLLKVTRVIDGSFQRIGDRMRCVAHIYSAKDAVQRWSQSFDSALLTAQGEPPMDLFSFQDHIAETVVSAALPTIDGALSPPRSVRALEPLSLPGVSVAMERASRSLFDQARYLYRRFDAASCDKIIHLAEQASRLDPENAQGQVLVALAYFQKIALNLAPGSAMRPKIETALARALSLDPADSEALALNAMIAFRFAYDWSEAERLFRAALLISPHASSINYRYAFCLIVNRRFDEGLKHLHAAVDLDPLNVGIRASAAQLRGCAGELKEAEADALDVLNVEPDHLFTNTALGLVHLYGGKPDAALARFDEVIARHPDHVYAYFARIAALGYAGRIADGSRELDALLVRLGDRYYPRYGLATALIGLGRTSDSYQALEQAARDCDPTFCSVVADPLFRACHADPAFVTLLARHGLRAAGG